MGGRNILVFSVFLILFMSSLAIITRVPRSQAQVSPDMYVDPPSTTVHFGTAFSVNVSVANVTDLGGWEFKLYFGNNEISVMSAAEGPFLQQSGPTIFFEVDITNNYNATHGRIWLTCAHLGHVPGVNGSGTLATIGFHASGSGNTTLSLVDTVLADSQANTITHTTNNGTVRVTKTTDIAITNVTPFKTVVGQGYTMSITVTAANLGDQNATFNVTTYTNNTATGNVTTITTFMNITLASDTSTNLTVVWNTTGFALGNYKISAYAGPIPGETDLTNNTYIDGVMQIVDPANINIIGGGRKCVW